MSFSFASIPQKKRPFTFSFASKKYFYPLLFVNFQPLIRIVNKEIAEECTFNSCVISFSFYGLLHNIETIR